MFQNISLLDILTAVGLPVLALWFRYVRHKDEERRKQISENTSSQIILTKATSALIKPLEQQIERQDERIELQDRRIAKYEAELAQVRAASRAQSRLLEQEKRSHKTQIDQVKKQYRTHARAQERKIAEIEASYEEKVEELTKRLEEYKKEVARLTAIIDGLKERGVLDTGVLRDLGQK